MQVVQEYERAVIFRLGRVVGGAKGPGKENLIYSLQCTYYTVMQLYFVTERTGQLNSFQTTEQNVMKLGNKLVHTIY